MYRTQVFEYLPLPYNISWPVRLPEVDGTPHALAMVREQDKRILEAVREQSSRLRNFIRRRVADQGDAEDILQEVFYELVEAYRLVNPIEHIGAWLFQVARNRIADWFRKKRPEAFSDSIEGVWKTCCLRRTGRKRSMRGVSCSRTGRRPGRASGGTARCICGA